MRRSTPVTVRNARFQQWEALLTNRSKRHHSREFLVHGVRPITSAVKQAWPLHALLHPSKRTLSQWATDLIQQVEGAELFELSGELLRELGERSETTTTENAEPELLAVAELPPDDLGRIPVPGMSTSPTSSPNGLVVAFDRPVSPGNIGTLIRSADALGADGVVVTGHAADPYDPKSVRSSTGSLFALPTVRMPSPRDVMAWAHENGLRVVGTDESGEHPITDTDLTGPTLLVVGNETVGMSRRWLEGCDDVARLPMPGARIASSLNAATAGTVALFETARQRGQQR